MWFEIAVIAFLFIMMCLLGDISRTAKTVLIHIVIRDQAIMTPQERKKMKNLRKLWKKLNDK